MGSVKTQSATADRHAQRDAARRSRSDAFPRSAATATTHQQAPVITDQQQTIEKPTRHLLHQLQDHFTAVRIARFGVLASRWWSR